MLSTTTEILFKHFLFIVYKHVNFWLHTGDWWWFYDAWSVCWQTVTLFFCLFFCIRSELFPCIHGLQGPIHVEGCRTLQHLQALQAAGGDCNSARRKRLLNCRSKFLLLNWPSLFVSPSFSLSTESFNDNCWRFECLLNFHLCFLSSSVNSRFVKNRFQPNLWRWFCFWNEIFYYGQLLPVCSSVDRKELLWKHLDPVNLVTADRSVCGRSVGFNPFTGHDSYVCPFTLCYR